MEKIKVEVQKWIKGNRGEFYILLLILAVAAFLRLYRIGEYMTFLGDEGRDAIIVRRLLVDFDPILVGPVTSIGNMYLGPLYYYLMAPALLVSGFNPVGPAVQIALIGVLTVGFVWFVVREWFPNKRSAPTGKLGLNIGALVAAGFYAISPSVIVFSRSSWNPNIMPFFSLLSVYSVWKVWNDRGYRWLLVLGVSFAFVLHSHYLGLLLVPTLLLFVFLSYFKTRDKELVSNSVYGLVIFLFLMSPLVIFDALHGWNNFGALVKFFTERQTTVSAKPWNALPSIWPLWIQFNERLIGARSQLLGVVFAVVLGLGFLYKVLTGNAFVRYNKAYLLLFSWFGFALLGLGLYKQHIYDHYFGFFFAAPFILAGGLTSDLVEKAKNKGRTLVFLGMALVVWYSVQNSPLRLPPNRQAQRAQEVASFIVERSSGERFNLAVVADRNYEDGYQYFIEKEGAPVVEIDAQRASETITDQLFVVCEMPLDKCDPTNSPKAEVANFGWTKVESEWRVFGVTIYKLIHTK